MPDSTAQADDRRQRMRILRALYEARRVPGGVNARSLRGLLDGGAMRFRDEDHFLAVLDDLFDAGYVKVIDHRDSLDEPYVSDVLRVEIEPLGVRFVTGAAPADRLIDDGRRTDRQVGGREAR